MNAAPSTSRLPGGAIRVRFRPDAHADFHARWLRHNCDRDLHPTTRERILCSSEIADDLEARSAAVEGDALVVSWSDGRESRYPLAWLEEHAYARDREVPVIPNDVRTISDDDVAAPLAERIERAIERVQLHGAAVVRRDPASKVPPEEETEAIVDAFVAAGLAVIGTHFGRIEDLRTDNSTNANTDQLGYTDAAIDLHTDQPFLEKPPRMQLLQCIQPAEEGGDTALVDALAAARHLRSQDAAAYELLTTTFVRFHRKQKAFEKILDARLLSGGGSSFQIRWSYFTLAPYQFPFERMEAWYRAHDRFARLVRDPASQFRLKLGRGDFVLYDNFRMLHARTAFRGARWLRGVYFDRSDASE